MGETKRMHHVPRVYLKHFAELRGEDYFIYALEKATGKIKNININNVCVDKNIYALPGDTEEARQFLETMYSELYESDYDEIYSLLTDPTQEGISEKQRYEIIAFVSSMFYRNAAWKNFHNRVQDDIYSRVYHASKENGHDHFFINDEKISIAGKTLEEILKSNHREDQPTIAMTMAKKIFELTRRRMVNDVITIVKTSGEFQYLTSDNPVTIRAEQGRYPAPIDPTTTLSMAIDNNHLVQLRPWAHELDKGKIWRMDEHNFIGGATVSINNQFQNAQSDLFVFGHLRDLETFREKPMGIFQGKIK